MGEVLSLSNRWPASCPALARAFWARSVLAAFLQVSGTASLLSELNMARPNAEVITPQVSVYLPICNGLLSWCHGQPWLGELWTASVDVRVCMVTNVSHKPET